MKKYNKWIFNVASGLALTSVIATSAEFNLQMQQNSD